MEFDHDIRLISQKFEQDHPRSRFPELMLKRGRPNLCLLIDAHIDYLICAPYRTNINHRNAYLFKDSLRSKNASSGIDHSKVIIIKDMSYIDPLRGVVDPDEYAETLSNLQKIVSNICDYIDAYKKHRLGTVKLHEREFARRYRYSTLPYFEELLGLTVKDRT